jgi:hypothetical protein
VDGAGELSNGLAAAAERTGGEECDGGLSAWGEAVADVVRGVGQVAGLVRKGGTGRQGANPVLRVCLRIKPIIRSRDAW